MTDRADVDRLSAAQRELAAMARTDIEQFFAGLDLAQPGRARDALLEVVPALVREYGELAAVAAADWYEQTRPAGGFTARAEAPAPDEKTVGSVRALAGGLFGDTPEASLGALAGSIQRHILYSGRETVARNVQLDPLRPRFARMPAGLKTCAWCEMLSSRGFVYHSRQSAGYLNRFHDDDNCQIVSSWDSDEAHIEGYDPDAMYGRYLIAREELAGAGVLAPSDRQVSQQLRSLFPSQYTDGHVH